MKIVIVGGVAGGASAAARARRLSEEAEIIMVERGSYPSFANCGMPYYIGGTIESRNKLLVSPIERLRQRYQLDVRVRESVESIDRANKQIVIRRLETGEQYTESYDKLILAPGAAPFRPPIPGIESPGIYTLRNLEDADRLAAATKGAQRAVVIGAGFIGIEMAENLVHRGLQTSLVELSPQILPPWDAEMVAPLEQLLRDRGVDLYLGDSATEFRPKDNGLQVVMNSGKTLAADFVVLAIGVRPESTLAADADLKVAQRGGIQVNRQQQTSDPDIYAVGDAIEVTDVVSGTPVQIPLAGPANRQGRIAADHIFGRDLEYRGTQGTAIVGLWDHGAAMTGLSEKACQRLGLEYEKVYLHPGDHAGYYPGATSMAVKVLFDPETGKLLGGQVVGKHGIDKRVDVLSMALQAGMSVFDLEESELAYAPQFGSAKDPINMAGFIAAGVLRGDQPVAHSKDLIDGEFEDAVLLDVRTPEEYAAGAIPGSVNVPLDELRDKLDSLPQGKPVVAYCKVGQRGYMATRILLLAGYQARNLSGGYTTYQQVVAASDA
ncbi:FAD-dependent oxidoreductase [Aeoliella sp. ICT_H6.2]|uniref:FAD-dependent oxidoreductase n=1 Tax=Aeoliella straminimaris TaxID=2954799 RepID=A0A9X2JHK0_9BACT|nr:FAD-dependent oxidoreductase [Aeoliella straminimaris]MCO6042989.1 FAD-dependent oxidoreductase [Aeoliella straminimaris]